MNRFSEQSKEKRGGSAAHLHVRALPGKMIIDRTVPSDRSEQDRRAASGLTQKARCRFCCRRRLRICHQEIVGCAGRSVRTGRVLRPCRPGKPAKCGQIKEKKPDGNRMQSSRHGRQRIARKRRSGSRPRRKRVRVSPALATRALFGYTVILK